MGTGHPSAQQQRRWPSCEYRCAKLPQSDTSGQPRLPLPQECASSFSCVPVSAAWCCLRVEDANRHGPGFAKSVKRVTTIGALLDKLSKYKEKISGIRQRRKPGRCSEDRKQSSCRTKTVDGKARRGDLRRFIGHIHHARRNALSNNAVPITTE